MLFAVICEDHPDRLALRLATRPAHLAYLEPRLGQVVTAGPLLADDGETSIGGLLIIEAEDRAAAERFATEDPYAKAGLFRSVTVRPWRRVIPAA